MDSFDVLKLENVAYVNSQIACAYVEMEGMKAENQQRLIQGASPAYSATAFRELIDRFQLGHNSVLTNLRNGL